MEQVAITSEKVTFIEKNIKVLREDLHLVQLDMKHYLVGRNHFDYLNGKIEKNEEAIYMVERRIG